MNEEQKPSFSLLCSISLIFQKEIKLYFHGNNGKKHTSPSGGKNSPTRWECAIPWTRKDSSEGSTDTWTNTNINGHEEHALNTVGFERHGM